MKRLVVVLIVSLAIALSGCKTVKTAAPSSHVPSSTEKVVEKVESRQYNYENLYAKINADVTLQNNAVSSKVELKMVKDSLIQLSVQPMFGIEVFRLALTTDSIKLLDRLNKRYAIESYSKMTATTSMAFNLYNLQSLLANHLFLPGKNEISNADMDLFTYSADASNVDLSCGVGDDITFNFKIDQEGRLNATNLSADLSQSLLKWNYQNFQLQNGVPFPVQMKVAFSQKGSSLFKATLDYSKMTPNTYMNTSFPIPEKYRKVTLDSILKQLFEKK